MTDFIEGAAYVSPSRQELYSSDGDGLYTRGGDWMDPTVKGFPTDLVMIWAPGDTVITATEPPLNRTIIHDHRDPETFVAWMDKNRAFYSAFNEKPTSRPVMHPNEFGGVRIGTNEVPREAVMRIFGSATADDPVVKYDQAGALIYQHPKTRGWFYPTRYNERPGRYVDEDGGWWQYRERSSGKRWFCTTTGDDMHEVPDIHPNTSGSPVVAL